ncbi:hypothetical protein Bhyg_07698 [Pseudolycoriella hygida]|uniref:DUF4780 domain-containing protein n=1 Tax=Pseudolycoriella hygida TaxID=35572 RepID=A0A9Q0N4Z8_9DIPT|nr:hypothetical protein Bhyg_07698 [Pseudolycoriella hygida]
MPRSNSDLTKESNEIYAMLSKLDKKMDTNLMQFNTEVDELQAELSAKFNEQTKSIKINTMVHEQCERIDSVESSIADNERVSKLNDVIVRGIPYDSNENLLKILQATSDAIGFEDKLLLSVNNIFRLGSGNKPILVQFVSNILKRQFMANYFVKLNLKLSDIGFTGNDSRIYCCDNLTSLNNSIHVKAVQLMKSDRKIQTRNGFVYVKFPGGSNFVKVISLSDLPVDMDSTSPLRFYNEKKSPRTNFFRADYDQDKFYCLGKKEMDSEAETISLDGKLFEASVDSDTAILSDSELEKEMENVNTTIVSEDVSEEEDDNINVTIREIKAPQPECPDPNVKPAEIPEVKGKRGTRLESAIVIRKDRARNGNGKQADLRTMMAKVSLPKSTTGNKSSKRHRSPSSTRKGKETNEQPRKQFKDRQAINTPKHPAQDRLNRMRKDMTEDGNEPIHRNATNDISMSNDESQNAPNSAGKEVAKMPTKFLEDKIFDAVMDDAFSPTFMENNRIGKDGLYLHCTDFSSAEWIRNTMTASSEFKGSRIVVVPQEEEINFKPQSSHVRVKACVPMRKSGEEILKTMAKLNKHLNTEKWHIKRIIPNGTVKSTLYIRMDIPSFEVIKSQNNQINWILGTIEIRQERYGNKQHKLFRNTSRGNKS